MDISGALEDINYKPDFMRSINFTHPGGFPLTQNELDHMQQAYTECINTLATLGGASSSPTIISGMAMTTAGSAVTISDGWFFYNGTMVKFTGSTVTPTGTNVPLIIIANNTTALTYNDGSTFPAVSNVTATLGVGPSVTTSSQFPYSAAVPYHTQFGINGREANWNTLGVGTLASLGGVTGTIYYKKNRITNTLTIQAQLTANNAQNFSASPSASNSLLGSLPAEYAPNTNVYFTTYYYAAAMFKDDLGVSWVKHLSSVINSAGQILINFIRPEVVVPAYTVVFNAIIPLD